MGLIVKKSKQAMEDLKLLVVEDNPLDQKLFSKFLSKSDLASSQVVFVKRLSDAKEQLEGRSFDVIVLDLGLPDSSGIDTFYKLKGICENTACIIMSGLADEEVAKTAVADGAHDYLCKAKINPESLVRSIRYAVKRQAARKRLGKHFVNEMNQIESGKVDTSSSVRISRPTSNSSRKELSRAYAEIITSIFENNMKKDLNLESKISKLAKQCYEQKIKAGDIFKMRNEQSKLSKTNNLHNLLCFDLMSQMTNLCFAEKFKVSIPRGSAVELV